MSNVEQRPREWRFYVNDMLEFGEKVLSYTEGMDQAGFVTDTLTYDATLRNLELIGEAATRIPSEVREAHSEIQWRDIIATRNRLAHGYLGIDDDVIWDIIQNDVPKKGDIGNPFSYDKIAHIAPCDIKIYKTNK